MKIEYISRICLSARGPFEQETQCPVSIGVFCQVVIDNEDIIFPAVEKIFCDSRCALWGNVLKTEGLIGVCNNKYGS